MSKKFIVGAILLVAFAQVGYAQTLTTINRTDHAVFIKENSQENAIWFENTNTWQPLAVNGRHIRLYMEESTPAHFALVYNTIKDYMTRGSGGSLIIQTTTANSPQYGHYERITQVHYK